jgi:hypothetical protein
MNCALKTGMEGVIGIINAKFSLIIWYISKSNICPLTRYGESKRIYAAVIIYSNYV